MKKSIVFIILIVMFASTGAKTTEVPRESTQYYATNDIIIVAESLI